MLKLFLSFLLLPTLVLASINTHSLSLNAEVDRTRLSSNESLRLIVTADESASETIDFSELSLQFDIINTQRSNQTSIVNGQVSASTQWILILTPKESGQLIIPSFEYRGIYSQAITITVTDSNTQLDKSTDREVFLQVTVDKNQLYVQEQLLLTMRLYYKTALSSYDDEELQLENTTITLVSETNFRSTVKGINYNVLEKIYALHPQASGELIIPAQSWRLEKALNRFNFGRSGNPYLYVRSEAATITVKPIAANSTATTWLPSTAVTLDAKWQQSIIQAKVGEPLNYQLVLIANGLTAAQLPDIVIPESDKFTIYTEQADIDDNKSTAGIIGTRVNNFAVIPRQTGSFTFPPARIKWWNIIENKEEIAETPEQTIVVVNPAATTADQLPPLPDAELLAKAEQISTSTIIWQVSTILFALISLLLAFFLFKLKQKKSLGLGQNPNTAESPSPKDLTRKALLRDIENAASQKNWLLLRTKVLHLGKHLTQRQDLFSLEELSAIYPDLKAHLKQLDAISYGLNQATREEVNTEALIELLKSLKKPEAKKTNRQLQSLYKI